MAKTSEGRSSEAFAAQLHATLLRETETLGGERWRPMLRYCADLHRRCVMPARPPLPHPWTNIGPGYCYGPAFGHFDLVTETLDFLPAAPEYARLQIENDLAVLRPDGLHIAPVWMGRDDPLGIRTSAHPPVWPVLAQEYLELAGENPPGEWLAAARRQLRWFETNRRLQPDGFYYTDLLTHQWESGMDQSLRFLERRTEPEVCVDATAHVCALYKFAADWAERRGEDPKELRGRAAALRRFIQAELFCDETGFFHDLWAIRDPDRRCLTFEGMWPVVTGAATPEQARRVVEENLLNPKRFFAKHPITSVAREEPRFELRMWRGPSWNSMTFWAGRGCLRYGFQDAAARMLGAALDATAEQFLRAGTLWEFYHPDGGPPETVQRKPHTPFNAPCRDYLGHNPLFAMARMHARSKSGARR
jgi:hypothetical protein